MKLPDQQAGVLSADPPFTGRSQELADLLSTVTSGARGDGGMVVIQGEAGIGKSRLLSRAAHGLTGPQLNLRTHELERAMPYRAFRRAVAHTFGSAPGQTGVLARALTEILDGTSQETLAAVHGAAGRLFSTLRDEAPVVITVDDLHLADDDTVVLLAALLSQEGPHSVVLVGTVRKPDTTLRGPLASLMDRMRSERLLWRFELGPLPDAQLVDLIEAVSGRPPTPDVIELIGRQSGGNPFFAIQALLNLMETDAAAADSPNDVGADTDQRSASARWTSVDDRGSAVVHRVLRVGPDARRFAEAVALLGSVSLGQLDLAAELAALSVAEAATVCDTLVGRGILKLSSTGECRFNHELVRDALYQQIGPAERWRWHTVAARSLAQRPASPDRDVQVAVHVRETAQYGDGHAIAVLTRAGEIAGAAAPRSAIPWYQQAIAITPPEQELHAELTGRMARIYLLAGQPEDAVEASRSALARLPEGSTRDRLIPLALEALVEHSRLDDAVRLIESEQATRHWGARLAAQAAYVLAMAGRPGEALAAAEPVLTSLSTLGPVERINSLVHLVHMRCVVDGYGAVDPLLDALREAADDGAPSTARLNAYSTISYVLAMQGETEACLTSLDTAQTGEPEPGWRLYQAELSVARAQNAANLGDWDSAVSLGHSAARKMEDTGSRAYLSVVRRLVAEILANRGEWAAAGRISGLGATGSPSLAAMDVAAQTTIDVLAGDVAAARSSIKEQLGRTAVLPRVRAMLLGRLAEIELEAGDAPAALAALRQIEEVWDGTPEHPNAVRNMYSRARATSDPDIVREGLAFAAQHGLEFARGQGLLYLGAMDVSPESNLQEAVRVFQRLGATPWRRRAAAELRNRGLKVPRHRAGNPTLLSEPEAQIARLVQLGRSNREIATAVCLSIKTVEAYLSRVYSKTGCSSRLELARALDRGLLD